MKIYDRDLTGTAAAESGRSQETQKSGRGATTPPAAAVGGSGDRVELSSALASVSRALASYQSDRGAKVQSLAVQFQAGAYQPNSLATSRGMVAEAVGAGAY
jgi:hypothetical protein